MCCLLSCLSTRLLLSAEQGFSTSLEARCTAVPSFSVCQLYNIKGEIQDESSLKSRARNNSCRSRDVQPSVWKHRIRVSGLSHLRQDSNMLWVRFLQGKGLPLLGTHLGPSRTVLKSSRCQSDQGPVSRKPLWLEHCTPSAGFPREQSPACWRDAGGPPPPPMPCPDSATHQAGLRGLQASWAHCLSHSVPRTAEPAQSKQSTPQPVFNNTSPGRKRIKAPLPPPGRSLPHSLPLPSWRGSCSCVCKHRNGKIQFPTGANILTEWVSSKCLLSLSQGQLLRGWQGETVPTF